MLALLPKSIPRPDAPDADLLRRFGPLVFGVCRRVLPDVHLAEDAFQAAFVVLARKADGVRAGQLPAWLHGVARKVALRARTMAGRRSKRETLTAEVPDLPCGTGLRAGDESDTAALDEAIADLPRHYRDAVLLCELQGVARADAAGRLGIAEGTLSSRLAKARKLLAEALSRKGFALPAAIAAFAVPLTLCASAVRAAVNAAPAAVSAIADGVTRTMLLSKLKLSAVLGAFAVLLFGLVGGPRPDAASAAPVPKEKDRGVIWMLHPATGELIGHTPDGKKARTVKVADGALAPGHFLGVTPDGRYALVTRKMGVVFHDEDTDPRGTPVMSLHLLPLFGDGKPVDTKIDCPAWTQCVGSHDGRTLFVTRNIAPPVPAGETPKKPEYETTAYDSTTLKGVKQPALPEKFTLHEVAANGDRVLSKYVHDGAPRQSFHLLPATGGKPQLLTDKDETDYCALSPDGAKLLVTRQFSSKSKPGDSFHRMFVIDRATGTAARIADHPSTQSAQGYWSPDGKRIVYQRYEEGQRPPVRNLGGFIPLPISRGEVVVCDADGGQPKVLLKLDGNTDEDFARFQEWSQNKPRLIGWFPGRSTK